MLMQYMRNMGLYITFFQTVEFTQVTVQSQERQRSCICVLGVSILLLFTIFLLNFGTVSTVWHFCFSFFSILNNIVKYEKQSILYCYSICFAYMFKLAHIPCHVISYVLYVCI